jgi:hypothetical protein
MLPFNQPVRAVIQKRFACRAYKKKIIPAETAQALTAAMAALRVGPLQCPFRFELALATEADEKALKGLGTYGLIKNAAGFVVGAAEEGPHWLEDYGFGLETILLYATSLGLDTCWLGGNFTKSSFAQWMRASQREQVPAVAAVGFAAEGIRTQDRLRQKVRSDQRLPWDRLFFQTNLHTPLPAAQAGAYAEPLEMLRWAPSSHNYQPWRVVQDGPVYHFLLQRTAGFGPGTPMFSLLGLVDLQRMEIGIAMAHFELTAREISLAGKWGMAESSVPWPAGTDYIISWLSE